MRHEEFAPPPALRESIQCFWHNRADFGAEATSFEVLPDGYAEIIFYFGSGVSIVCDGGLRPLPSPFIMGLLNQPVLLSAQGRFEILAVRCFPWTVFDLLGLASGQDEVRVLSHPVAQLQPALASALEAGQVEAALALLAGYFLDAAALTRSAPDRLLSRAGGALRESRGSMPVHEVAAAAHATVRTLERRFKQSSGRTVRDVAGLMRFEQVRNRLVLEPDASLAELAQAVGYTDQSHLSREFKRYSGMTPSAFARKRQGGR